MNNVDSLTSNVTGGIEKKRGREIVDVSARESVDENHAQRNKTMESMNMSKDFKINEDFTNIYILMVYFS